MAATTKTLSVDLAPLVDGADFATLRVWVTVDQPRLTDLTTGATRVGPFEAIKDEDTATSAEVELPDNSWDPSPHWYRLHVQYRTLSFGDLQKWVSGSFQMDTDKTLADLPLEMPQAVDAVEYASFFELIEQADQARVDAVAAQQAAEEARDSAVEVATGDLVPALGALGLPQSGFDLSASNAQELAADEYVAGMSVNQAAIVAMVAAIADREGLVFIESYPRQGAEVTDDGRLDRAMTDMAARGATTLIWGPKTYDLINQHNSTINSMVFQGVNVNATTIKVNADVTAFNVTGTYTVFRDLRLECTTAGRTVFPVIFNDTFQGTVDHCYFRGVDGSRFAGVYFKAVTSAASTGLIDHCTFSHACIRVETWDVDIANTYVWAMSCDYAIGIFNGAGNGSLTKVKIVPPLKSTATGLAGLYFDPVSGHSGTWDGEVYLDGNPSLSVRQGIYIGDGWYNIDLSVKANKMDSDCVVIDSAYNITVDYHGENNNADADGSVDIRVKQTGAQPVEKIRIKGQCLRTSGVASGGTAGPAVKVESSVTTANEVDIDVDVKHPASGDAGYTTPEIDVPISGGYPTQRVGKSRGKRSVYRAAGTVACASGDTGKTIVLGGGGFPMAYRPRLGQITLAMESAGQVLPAYRITYTNDNQIFVAFATALTAAGTLHYRVQLD